MKSKKASILIIITLFLFFGGVYFSLKALLFQFDATKQYGDIFVGAGTYDEPYQISNYEDICKLRDLINSANNFRNIYFEQTCDIDMSYIDWEPMGTGNNSFQGIYDGKGYKIYHLKIERNRAALFDHMEGVIINLRIEKGKISGENAASFVVESNSEDAAIINCYSNATILGDNVAGIALKFYNGKLVCNIERCCLYSDEQTFGLIKEGKDVKIYSCFGIENILYPAHIQSKTSAVYADSFFNANKRFETKFNILEGLSQCLFANKYFTNIIEYHFEDNGVALKESKLWILLLQNLNYLILPVLLFVYIIYSLCVRKTISEVCWNRFKKDVIAEFIISAIIAFFFDIALIYRYRYFSIGAMLFAVGIHFILINSGMLIYSYGNYKQKISAYQFKRYYSLYAVCGICILAELLQFKNVPHFDGTIYYGSLINGVDSFNLDLMTYIGSFACWKWIHGLALFLAPFEYIFHGEMIGIYMVNVFITILTTIFLFIILKNTYPNLSINLISLLCLIFNFFPYQMGLFTYLCMDYHLVFFSVWLIYSIYKKNDILICFCGYLLCFTKITGAIFYVGFLLIYGISEIIMQNEKNIFRKFKKWFDLKKVILWIMPPILFFITFLKGEHLIIQNFYGTYTTNQMIKFKTGYDLYNTLSQSFIFGFRWLIIIFFIIIIFFNIINRKKCFENVNNSVFIISSFGASLIVLLILLLYNSDAVCPRYTAIMNNTYIFILAFVVDKLSDKKYTKQIVTGILCVGFIIQNYFNIDPTLYRSNSLNFGTFEFKEPTVRGTKSGLYYEDNEFMSDYYVYNYMHTAYDTVLEKLFSDKKFDYSLPIYVLDIQEYELHINGSYHKNYKIYWNTRLRKRTYDRWDNDSVFLDVYTLSSKQVLQGEYNLDLPEHFYILVPARIDSKPLEDYLLKEDYGIINSIEEKNIYTGVTLIEIEK